MRFADEWLDASSSDLVESSLRVALACGNDTNHLIRFTRINRPPVLFASLFWGAFLEKGLSGRVEAPREIISGDANRSRQDRGNTILEYEVSEIIRKADGCHATVSA